MSCLFQSILFTIRIKEILVWAGLLFSENFRTSRRAVQYPILAWVDLLLFDKHSDFRNPPEGLPNNPILLTVIQNLGGVVSTEDIKKIR